MSKLPKNVKTCNQPYPPSPNLMGGGTRLPSIEFDTLLLNLSIDSSKSKLFKKLKELKAVMQETELTMEQNLVLKSGATRFNLQRTGVRSYPYVLKSGDLILFLSERDHDSAIVPARVQIGSVSCQNGVDESYNIIKGFLRHQGINIKQDQVSRVDLCADMFGWSLTDRKERIFDEDYFVCKARSSALYRENRKITGVQVGSGILVLRIYDKLIELSKPKNEPKLDFFTKKWGCLPSACTRVEFQIRRNVLKEILTTGTFKDLQNNTNKIWSYLTKIWFRHTEKPVDRKNRNQDKGKMSNFWQAVQKVIKKTDPVARIANRTVNKSLKQLHAQLRGILTTIIAGNDFANGDFFTILNCCMQIARDEIANAMSQPNWNTVFDTRKSNTVLQYDIETEEEQLSIFDNPKLGEYLRQIHLTPSLFKSSVEV
ncbi:MAG: hypothetical protein OCC45_06440 [Desulfotalea sp.]